MLWALVLLAPISLIASDLPRAWAWTLALFAAAWALRDARRYRVQPLRALVIPTGNAVATCEGTRIHDLQVSWRGPLAFLRWRDPSGRRHRAAFWPDTLQAGMRRELKRAMQRREAAPEPASMAG